MQDSDKKPKHAGKHTAPVEEMKPDVDDVVLDDFDLSGEEGEIPLRLKNKKKPVSLLMKG